MIENSTEKQLFNGSLQVILSTAVFLCMLWLGEYYWKKRHFYRKISKIPNCTKGIFGTLGDFAGKSIDGCLQQVFQYFLESPDVFKGWVGWHLVVGVSKPEHLAVVMSNSDSLGKRLDFLKPFLGDGIFSAPVDIWKKNRKLINPCFNQQILNSYIPIFQEKCEILIEILDQLVGQHDVDIKGALARCTLDIICETSFGAKVEAQTSNNRFAISLQRYLELTTMRIMNMFLHPQIIFNMSKAGKESREIVTELNDFTQKVITQQRGIHEDMVQEEYTTGKEKSHTGTLLQHLMGSGTFNDKQLQNEVNTFITAGDTSSLTISFCLITLGMHPEYQQKVYEEAIEVLGEDRYASKEDLPELKFTEMLIKETLRLFPASPLLVRVASADIEIDDLFIPKDATIMMGILHLHRNPKYWEDPLRFNPYRFLPENWAKKHPFSYLPFSGGPRNCIGYKYAMMVMKLILSKIVRKFIVKTDYKSIEEVKMRMHITGYPSHGFKISLEHRE